MAVTPIICTTINATYDAATKNSAGRDTKVINNFMWPEHENPASKPDVN